MTPSFPIREPRMSKRVVVLYSKGRYPGLRQIIGTDDELEGKLPAVVPQFLFLDHLGPIRLSTVSPRYALYLEAPETPEVPL